MMASLAGQAVTDAAVQIPAWGVWWADVSTTGDDALSGAATLVLADIELRGTIVSGGVHAGRGRYRLAGGAGSWGRDVGPQGYQDDDGVQAATLLQDAASAVGETLGALPQSRLGQHYARTQGPASRVLHELAPRAWYVDLAGVTQFGERTPRTYTGDAPRVDVDPCGLVTSLATETLAGLLPGVVVDGGEPATDVECVLTPQRLTARIWSGPRPSRRLDAWRRIFEALDPRRIYRSVYEFRVSAQSGERLNLQPVRVASGMPDLENVPVRPGVAGVRATVTPGALVLVAFVDADPSRPVVIAHDDAESPGFLPVKLDIGPTPILGAARMTDPVQAGPFAGTITMASTTTFIGN